MTFYPQSQLLSGPIERTTCVNTRAKSTLVGWGSPTPCAPLPAPLSPLGYGPAPPGLLHTLPAARGPCLSPAPSVLLLLIPSRPFPPTHNPSKKKSHTVQQRAGLRASQLPFTIYPQPAASAWPTQGLFSLSVVAPTQRAFSVSPFLSSRASISPTVLMPAPWPHLQPCNIRVQAAAVTYGTLSHLEKQLQFTGEVESPFTKPSPLTDTSPAKSQSPSHRQTQVIHPRAQAHVGDNGNFCMFSTLQGLEQLPMSSGDAPKQFMRCE